MFALNRAVVGGRIMCSPASKMLLCQQRSVVTAALIKELREKSGAPMMECKKALSDVEVSGDISKAMDWLRKKGIARASSNADRAANEGLVGVHEAKNGTVALVEINSETDFVTGNHVFQDFVALVLNTVSHSGVVDIEKLMDTKPVPLTGSTDAATIKDSLGELISVIRENIVVKRAEVVVPTSTTGLAAYVHSKAKISGAAAEQQDAFQMGKAVSLVQWQTDKALEAAVVEKTVAPAMRRVAMHVVAAQPQYLDSTSVPDEWLEKEMSIIREMSANEQGKKKPEIFEKILQGKLNKRMSEVCLLDQPHMVEEKGPVIKKHVEALSAGIGEGVNLRIPKFWRWYLSQ